MAIEPQNLIQVQSSLQDPFTVKNEDLIKYANGSNPEVPAFLALIEMNRRKQIEEGSAALDTTKGTIKDQVAGALTTAPTGINPTANPYTVNPTAAPNMVNPAAAQPDQGITQLPQGFNPTQAPPMQQPSPARPVMAAGGGLMSLPVNHFNESSYAGGGIVAFQSGGETAYKLPKEEVPDYALISDQPNQSDAERVRLLRAEQEARIRTGRPMLESAGTTLVNLPTDETPVPRAAPVAAPKPGSYEAILASLPKAPEITSTAPQTLSRAQAFEGIKESQKLAGVKEDPYAEATKRQTAKEKREQEVYERGGIDRLIAQASAFAKADPARGIGYQGAVAAEASAVLQKEQDIIRDKQETAAIEFHKSIAKEEDAKRRGDAAGIEAAVAEREKAKREFDKLTVDAFKVKTDLGTLAANIYGTQETATTQRAANANTAAYQKGMLGYYNEMARIAEATKPSAEDKAVVKAEAATNADPQYKREAERIGINGGLEPGSPEFNAALQRMYEIRAFHFKTAKAELPPLPPLPLVIEMAKKPGWWARNVPEFLGGAPSGPKPVKFEDLPK